MIFEIISGGEKTDWVGKEWAGLFFPWGKNGPAHSFPGEKTDWGEIPACYSCHEDTSAKHPKIISILKRYGITKRSGRAKVTLSFLRLAGNVGISNH